ncbi:MAG: site-2 protease family protein [Nitrospirota bacterium]
MLIAIAAFVGVFTVAVLVHEFGHFLAARKAGVKVYEFSIGFPFSPKIFTLFRHRETEFTLRLLPLGGFVSFSRDSDEEAKDLFGVSPPNRALILAAGSLFNVAFAFLLFVVLFAMEKNLSLPSALAMSVNTVWSVLLGTLGFLVKTFSGHGSWEGVAGPVGCSQSAQKGSHFWGVNIEGAQGQLHRPPLPFFPRAFSRNLIRER